MWVCQSVSWLCNSFKLISIIQSSCVCRTYVQFIFTSHYICVCVHNFRPVQRLIIEHTISITTASMTDIQRKLLLS